MNILCNRRLVSCDDLILESMKSAEMANVQQHVHRNYGKIHENHIEIDAYSGLNENKILKSQCLTYMLLNILSNAVNAKPVATIDFIFTIDKSRLLFLSFSSSRSIFFLCCLSSESPSVSLRFSTKNQLKSN